MWNLAHTIVPLQSLLMIQVVTVATACLGIVCCAPSPGPIKRRMVGLLERFDRWDYNGDGQLSAAELRYPERLGGFSAEEIIDFYDKDGDRLISLKEAQGGMKRVDEAREIADEILEDV